MVRPLGELFGGEEAGGVPFQELLKLVGSFVRISEPQFPALTHFLVLRL